VNFSWKSRVIRTPAGPESGFNTVYHGHILTIDLLRRLELGGWLAGWFQTPEVHGSIARRRLHKRLDAEVSAPVGLGALLSPKTEASEREKS
jgi:hypothetical protein